MRRAEKFRDDRKKISAKLEGIEWLMAVSIHIVWPLFISFWLQKLFKVWPQNIFKISLTLIIEIYVVFSVALTVAIWWVPNFSGAIFCSYISISSIVSLLHVVFLSKVFGGVESPERSLILFVLNVTQIVFMFSIWYELVEPLTKGDALFMALLVFGTLGHPEHTKLVAGIQIATDFLLLAIFLAHLVGRVGVAQDE